MIDNIPFYRFAYSTMLRDGEEPRPFRTRDGAAFCELAAALDRMGGEYRTLIYNSPADPRKDATLGRRDFDFLRPEDWIVMTTRPPMDDETHGDKRFILRSHTHLENSIFREFRVFFEVCARSRVRLTPEIGASFHMADLSFRQTKDARLVAFNGLTHASRATQVSEDEYTSIGFFLRKEGIRDYGCNLLACFSMGGVETLVWNRIVRVHYPDWLRRNAFIVAKLEIGKLPTRPSNLSFVEKVNASVLLDVCL